MKEIVEQYLRDYDKARGLAENTIANRRSTLLRFLQWCADSDLDWRVITHDQLVDWIHNMPIRGQSKQKLLHRLRSFYQWAVINGKAKANPAQTYYKPKRSDPRAMRKSLTEDEVEKILDVAPRMEDTDFFIAMYSLACPVRLDELVRLRVKDIDVAKGTIYFWGTKTTKPRWQVIPRRVVPVVERLIRRKRPDDQVLGFTLRTANRRVAAILETAGIDAGGRNSHAFRHTVIERMIFRDRKDVNAVAEVAGNSPATIQRIYLNSVPERVLIDTMRDAERF